MIKTNIRYHLTIMTLPEAPPVSARVSINLCCYNSEEFLEETLQTIQAQTFTDWELVIINDGSSDSTDEIIKRYASQDARIVYHSQQNIGLSRSRNRAIELSRGEFIAFIDHDDLWEPTHLEAQVNAFTDDRIGLVYTDRLNIQDDREHPICRMSEYLTPASGDVFFDIVAGVYINPSMAMVRKSVLDDVGLFDVSYHFVEEADLFLRIARKYHFAYIDEPLTVYRYHEGNFSNRFVNQQAETLRFRTELLRDYPDIRERMPQLEREWTFNYHARYFRWYVSTRNYVRAVWSLVLVGWQGLQAPKYACERLKAFLDRWSGKTPTADWLS
jgi:glycosyltransferase involved in cell wall biosynthesis